MQQIQTCLIVAAGMGTRLKAHGDIKPLVQVNQLSLIEHAMINASKAGVTRFVVVTGYRHQFLEEELEKIKERHSFTIQTAHNKDYEKPNGLSVLKGAPLLSGPFFLTMCDHMVESAIYEYLSNINLPEDHVALGVDFRLDNSDVDIEDVTKVLANGPYIKKIGKNISDYNGYDTGVFLANSSLFEAIEQSARDTDDPSISGGMEILSNANRAVAVDTKKSRWLDVDSPDILKLAQEWQKSKA